ncbi:hypothetical protein PybrP1_002765 [[Pythium] brassicae (nom. inval.)]|nr:hypothetical protein PybrP1_002765 [[Pythium] brassicae (nom. inval.)]
MKLAIVITAIALASVLGVSPITAANATVAKCKVVPKTPAPTAASPVPTPKTPMLTLVPTPIPVDDDETSGEYDGPSQATKKPTRSPRPTKVTRMPTAAPKAIKAVPKPTSATTPTPVVDQDGVDPVTCLAAHNKLRAEVGVPPLTWDPALATKGATWAQHMEDLNFFDHRTPGKSDDQMNNLYSGTDCLGAVEAFGGEKFKLPTDRIVREESYMEYGHYTMVVWRTTTRLGCGRGKTQNLACYYEQPGNVIGQAAY